jgi:hypothetical protein
VLGDSFAGAESAEAGSVVQGAAGAMPPKKVLVGALATVMYLRAATHTGANGPRGQRIVAILTALLTEHLALAAQHNIRLLQV